MSDEPDEVIEAGLLREVMLENYFDPMFTLELHAVPPDPPELGVRHWVVPFEALQRLERVAAWNLGDDDPDDGNIVGLQEDLARVMNGRPGWAVGLSLGDVIELQWRHVGAGLCVRATEHDGLGIELFNEADCVAFYRVHGKAGGDYDVPLYTSLEAFTDRLEELDV